MKWRIWNDIFPDVHPTHVPSENDKNTIVDDIFTLITSVNIN